MKSLPLWFYEVKTVNELFLSSYGFLSVSGFWWLKCSPWVHELALSLIPSEAYLELIGWGESCSEDAPSLNVSLSFWALSLPVGCLQEE